MSIQLVVTNGSVSVEDGIPAKTGDFDPKRKVKVEINFTVPENEGAQPYLDAASIMASSKVNELLGKVVAAKPAAAPKPAEVTTLTPAPAAAPVKPAGTRKKVEPVVEKTKADLEAEMLASAAKPAETPTVEDEDPLADLLGDTAPTPVTDKELSAAAIAKADKMKAVSGWDAKKIRLLVEKFAGKAGSKFHEVPADKRHDFLKELDALK